MIYVHHKLEATLLEKGTSDYLIERAFLSTCSGTNRIYFISIYIYI